MSTEQREIERREPRGVWVTIWAKMSPVYHAELQKILHSADKSRRTLAFKPTRTSTTSNCECNSRRRFIPEMGEASRSTKCEASQRVRATADERFVLLCVQEMVGGNLKQQRDEVGVKRRGRLKKKSKYVPLHSTPFGQNIQTSFWPLTAAIEILWLQLVIALTLCSWYVSAKQFSTKNFLHTIKNFYLRWWEKKITWNRNEKPHWRMAVHYRKVAMPLCINYISKSRADYKYHKWCAQSTILLLIRVCNWLLDWCINRYTMLMLQLIHLGLLLIHLSIIG